MAGLGEGKEISVEALREKILGKKRDEKKEGTRKKSKRQKFPFLPSLLRSSLVALCPFFPCLLLAMSSDLNQRCAKCAEDGDLPGLVSALQEGAWVDFQDSKWGWTSLMWAVYANHQDIVEYLCTIARADTNVLDVNGKMALHVAW